MTNIVRRIIVTDLTRFSDEQIVCIAGIDIENRRCIRPMPYLKKSHCQKLNILPGAILSGTFSPMHTSGPHQEDMNWSDLKFNGPSASKEFKEVLDASLFNSVEKGFEISLGSDQKHIPIGHDVGRSIITIQIVPRKIELVEDAYNPGRIKVNLEDHSGHSFKYLPLTDLGFYRYALKHREANDLGGLNSFISGQSDVYLRIGLSRAWNNGTVNGYWIQVNGIYTFPEYHHEIRSYS